jgi:hypothetical protein
LHSTMMLLLFQFSISISSEDPYYFHSIRILKKVSTVTYLYFESLSKVTTVHGRGSQCKSIPNFSTF